MADKAASGVPDKRPAASKPVVLLIAVVLLSLATWSFFYVMQMPLTAVETSVIVGFWLLMAFSIRWVFGRLRHKKE
jgi:drug/metabolite transporter (DMT)-like permease